MSERREIREFLACENHGDRGVDSVCGECGTPVCDDCSTSVTDLTLDHYTTDGFARLGLALMVVLAGLVLVDLVPRQFWLVLVDIAGQPLYIQGGLKQGLILLGIGLLLTGWIRTTDEGFGVMNRQALLRKRNARTVCEDCYGPKRTQRAILVAFWLLGAGIAVYGLYQSFSGLNFGPLRISGLGAGLWVLRYELATAVVALIE